MSEERWLPVPGYEFYDVSDLGRVRSWHKTPWNAPGDKRANLPKLRKQVKRKEYMYVMLKETSNSKTLKNFTVHGLVALAFLGIRPDGFQVAHGDGNGQNNNLENLSYKTPKENSADKIRHGTVAVGFGLPHTKLSDEQIRDIREAASGGVKAKDLLTKYPVSISHIFDIISGKKRKVL